MKYPIKQNRAFSDIKIPNMLGGLNYRDSISDVADNQLTDSSNVWENLGLLCSRSGMQTNSNMPVLLEENSKVCFTEVKKIIDGEHTRLMFAKTQECIKFWWQSSSKITEIASITVFDQTLDDNLIVFESGGKIYAFGKDKVIYRINKNDLTDSWQIVSGTDIYAPRVMIHAEFINGVFTGTNFEGYNLIGNRYRIIASAIPRNSTGNIPLSYTLINDLPRNATVKAILTLPSGTHEHTVTCIDMEETTEGTAQQDGYRIRVNPNTKVLTFIDGNGNTVYQNSSDFIEDNLEINACYFDYDKNNSIIFGMNRSLWFGGSASGLMSGTRLFLYGSDTNKNLVCWSSLNNPLYFPERNNYSVGTEDTKVIAIAKQNNTICLFKEDEIYYSYYADQSYTGDDLIEQKTIDVESQGVYFPLILLTNELGCDVPYSVELCRNRLVFANSAGHIYSLINQNQNSERNVFKLSEMVERVIDIPQTATSADIEGYYCLHCGNTIWLMKYDSYGYQYAYSYSKNEDANIKIPWFKFDIEGVQNIYNIGEDLLLFRNESGYTYASVISKKNTQYTDDKLRVIDNNIVIETNVYNSFIKTKAFDFGVAGIRKIINSIRIGSGNESGNTITVSLLTDKGNEELTINPQFSENSPYSEEYLKSIFIYPTIKGFTKIAIKIETNGMLNIENMMIKIKLLGSER